MAQPDISRREPHDEAEELLPWYATGQLSESERIRVETHLSSCADCRQQLSLERRFVQEFRALAPEVESGWSRLRTRINSPARVLRPTRPTPLEQFWAIVSRPVVAGLVTAQLAFVLIGAGVLMSLSKPVYHTLGSAAAPASANVIVMFRPETRVGDVDDALRSAGASIVDGPTDANAYLLHVAPGRREAALSRLQSIHEVQLAQPIDGVAR